MIEFLGTVINPLMAVHGCTLATAQTIHELQIVHLSIQNPNVHGQKQGVDGQHWISFVFYWYQALHPDQTIWRMLPARDVTVIWP